MHLPDLETHDNATFYKLCSRGHSSMRTEVDRQVSVKAPGLHKYVGVVGCSHQVAYCGEETAVQQNESSQATQNSSKFIRRCQIFPRFNVKFGLASPPSTSLPVSFMQILEVVGSCQLPPLAMLFDIWSLKSIGESSIFIFIMFPLNILPL